METPTQCCLLFCERNHQHVGPRANFLDTPLDPSWHMLGWGEKGRVVSTGLDLAPGGALAAAAPPATELPMGEQPSAPGCGPSGGGAMLAPVPDAYADVVVGVMWP